MAKIIRSTYRRDVSFGILVIIFAVVFFLADQLFDKHQVHLNGFINLYLAKGLVSAAVILMILIMWEEILFNIHVKPVEDDGFIFRNHGTKLKFQALIYLVIPVIIVFLYMNYNVSTFRFFGWACVVGILPIIGKLKSGIKNYNDFLKLTAHAVAYKNNELHGTFALSEIKRMELMRDEDHVLHKVRVTLTAGHTITIDIDEMELHDFYEAIEEYIKGHYAALLNPPSGD